MPGKASSCLCYRQEKKEEEKEEEEEGKGELSTAWTAAANMATEAGVVAGRKGESDLG